MSTTIELPPLSEETKERLRVLEKAAQLRKWARDWNAVADATWLIMTAMAADVAELMLPEPNTISDDAFNYCNLARAMAFKLDVAARRLEQQHRVTNGGHA